MKWGVVQSSFTIGQSTKYAVFDGSRSGMWYSGHIRNEDGSLGDAVQFTFLNDPGVADLLDADDVVEIKRCPDWLSSDRNAYVATLSPWAAMG